MKNLYILIFAIILLAQSAFSQSRDISSFVTNNPLIQYFEEIEQVNSCLNIRVKEDFFSLSDKEKRNIMNSVFASSNELLLLSGGYQRELWAKDGKSGKIIILDSWNANVVASAIKPLGSSQTLQRTETSPWYYYIGGNMNWGAGSPLVFNYNVRIGTFLFKNVWDIALTYGSSSINNDAGYTNRYSFGLMSRVYYPIKKIKLNPYLGGGISYQRTEDHIDGVDDYFTSKYWNKYIVVGACWYVGPGGLDVGFQFGNGFTTTVGYTFSPKIKKKDK